MFKNVPNWLTEKITALKGGDADREEIYLHAAGWTIAWYLRKNIRDPNADSFFELPSDTNGMRANNDLWRDFANRAILIGETLFCLRNTKGFEEQRARMEKRSLRSAFFEMMAAYDFFEAGYEISARPETFKRGDDFDFEATKDGQTINVEVTALDEKEFYEPALMNRLRSKRTQVPVTAPAVIFCVIPRTWTSLNNVNWDALFERTANEFFASTKRVNVINFVSEVRITGQDGRLSMMVRKAYQNKKTYHELDLPFLFSGRTSVDAMMALATGVGITEFVESSYDSEFFRWVDSIVFSETFNRPDAQTQSINNFPPSLGGNRILRLDDVTTLRLGVPYSMKMVTLVLNAVPVDIEVMHDPTKVQIMGAQIYFGKHEEFVFDVYRNRRREIEASGRTFIVTLNEVKRNETINMARAIEWVFSISEK